MKKEKGKGTWLPKRFHQITHRLMKLSIVLFLLLSTQAFTVKVESPVSVGVKSSNPKINWSILNIENYLKGKVVNEKGEPLVGVTVKVKGKNRGAFTNEKGEFKIQIDDNKITVLQLSCTGYKSQEISVTNSELIVTMVSQPQALEDVVVIGYGTVKRKDLTGSVAKVNISDVQKAPVKSIDDALAGRIAGVQVSSSDGQPGTSASIVIRGANSITQDNSPLYVVDGFPIENFNFNTLNQSDIESIEVLKDASSTAIYGSRGANGVIIVTTKKGKEGVSLFNFNVYTGNNVITKKMKVLSPYDFVKLQFDIDSNGTKTNYFKNGRDLNYYKTATPIDWQGLFFKPGITNSCDIAISGGSQRTKYSISGSMFNQQGVIINSGYSRYQGRFTLDNTVNEKMKVGINVNYANTKSNGVSAAASTAGTFSSTLSLLYSVIGGRPVTGDSANIINTIVDPLVNNTVDYRVNSVVEAQNELKQTIVNNIIANAYMDYSIVKNLKFRVTGGVIGNLQTNNNFNNSKTQTGNINLVTGANTGVNGSVINLINTTWSNENTLTYSNLFNNKHSLNVVVGFSSESNQSSSNGAKAIFLPNENLGLSGLDQGTPVSITATSSNWFLASAYGRINYSYLGRYLFTATYRADGSSKFAEGHKWGYFPSMAVAWRFSDEGFVKERIPFLNEGKLRYSYGVTGNNSVSDFPYISTLNFSNSTTGYPFDNNPTTYITQAIYGNPNLKWETTSQSNIGMDLSFIQNRVQLTMDYYRKATHDLLLNASLPYETGFDYAYKNIGKVSNEGFEFSITTQNVKTQKFSWISTFNISFNKSKVLELNQGQESLLTSMTWNTNVYTSAAYMAKINNPIALFYGYKFDGVYQYSDFDRTASGGYILKGNVPNNGNVRANIQPGDIKFRDINGDGKVDASDQTVIGNPNPLHIGGFSNNFTYKGFDLAIFFQWSYGNDILNANRYVFEGESFGANLNMFDTYKNRWTPTNPSNTIARRGGTIAGDYNSRVIEDGSFLRLKTVQLSYNLPNELLKKYSIRGIRLYVSGQNLITWTKYSGYDPEVSVRYSALTPGFDYSSYPRSRTIVLGLNLSF